MGFRLREEKRFNLLIQPSDKSTIFASFSSIRATVFLPLRTPEHSPGFTTRHSPTIFTYGS